MHRWPASVKDLEHNSLISAASLQKDLVDAMPQNWCTISLTLSETCEELYLVKYCAGESPFVLRLPLARHVSQDTKDDVLGFAAAKMELRDIIELSNFSAHTARTLTGREVKKNWWIEREALDLRLKELLMDVESAWFGGFRGIFSRHCRIPDRLYDFQNTMDSLLDKYLPSRRPKNSRKQKKWLDPRIWELFVGLGEPDGSDADLEDNLTDLLYFVVDILQYNGERNAYDEIDIDAV